MNKTYKFPRFLAEKRPKQHIFEVKLKNGKIEEDVVQRIEREIKENLQKCKNRKMDAQIPSFDITLEKSKSQNLVQNQTEIEDDEILQ